KPEPKPVPVPKPPEPKPVQKPAEKTPPDKNGMKKPVPPVPEKKPEKAAPAKPALDLDALAQTAASPSKAPARTLAQANTHKTNGASNNGSGPADAGTTVNNARTELGRRIMRIWNPNCGVPGANQVSLIVRIWPSHGGRILRAAVWENQRGDPVWDAAFSRARAAIAQVDIGDLNFPENDYADGIQLHFDAASACRGQ
ncbi:MAG: hypothetical protein ACXU8U_12905, partial [Asticcacaulis sp.]